MELICDTLKESLGAVAEKFEIPEYIVDVCSNIDISNSQASASQKENDTVAVISTGNPVVEIPSLDAGGGGFLAVDPAGNPEVTLPSFEAGMARASVSSKKKGAFSVEEKTEWTASQKVNFLVAQVGFEGTFKLHSSTLDFKPFVTWRTSMTIDFLGKSVAYGSREFNLDKAGQTVTMLTFRGKFIPSQEFILQPKLTLTQLTPTTAKGKICLVMAIRSDLSFGLSWDTPLSSICKEFTEAGLEKAMSGTCPFDQGWFSLCSDFICDKCPSNTRCVTTSDVLEAVIRKTILEVMPEAKTSIDGLDWDSAFNLWYFSRIVPTKIT